MSTFSTVEDAREFFKNDRFASANGIELDELFDDGCLCSMEIRDDHRNALGGVMGGVIFTLADFALAVSTNNDHSPTVALDASVSFLSASRGSRLFARSHRIKSGKTTSMYRIDVTDDLGKQIAFATGTGYKL